MIKIKSKIKILFFGRSKCNATSNLLEELIRRDFDVKYVESRGRSQKIPKFVYNWEGDYILCFRSLLILPEEILKKPKYASINFHPGPPEYRGSGCINFALYDDCKNYGVTAHLMDSKIDNGRILEVKRFIIKSNDNLETLLSKTHEALYQLCLNFISKIAEEGNKFIELKLSKKIKERWSGKVRLIKEVNNLQNISLKVNKKELYRIIRATYIKDYPPKIVLHGQEFFLRSNNKNKVNPD